MSRLILLLGCLLLYPIALTDQSMPLDTSAMASVLSSVQQTKRRVLVIYSYHDTLPWQAKLRAALFARLDSVTDAQRPELFEERFEAHRLTPLISNKNFLALLEAKYSNVKLDLLITENDYAFDFLKKNPNFLSQAKRQSLSLTQGRDDEALVVREEADKALETLLQVLPNTKRVIAIVEQPNYSASNFAPYSASVLSQFKSLQPLLLAKNIQLDIWDDFSFAELYERVQKLPHNTAILYFPVTQDRTGAHQIPRDLLRDLSRLSSVPIFVHHDSFIGIGAIGGYVISATKVGDLLGRMILGLELPKTRAEINAATKGNYFDDYELKRWHISDDRLPADSIILNRKQSIFYTYRWQITGTLIAFMVESLLILTLFRSLRQRNQATQALAEERDFLEYRIAEHTRELAESRNLFRDAAKVAKFGVFDYDLISGDLKWDDSMFSIYGVERDTFFVTYRAWRELLLPADSHAVDLALHHAITGEAEFAIDFGLQRPDHQPTIIYAVGQVYRDNTGQAVRIVCFNQDITERKLSEERIHYLAFFDYLTNLPNRRLLHERLQHNIAIAERESKYLAVLMLDLDRFKAVNDGLGHASGDELLKQVAERLSARLREVDTVARLGGDEFTVLLTNLIHDEDAGRVAEAIINDLARPFQLSLSDDVRIGVSIGISLYPQHGNTPEILLDHADLALYQAKKDGRGCFAYFSSELTRVVHERINLEARLRKAIEQQELRVFYQPQVDIASGAIVGAEALVRWQDPQHGLISPANFIPLAEETGLIIAIGEWVLRETCRQGQAWLNAGLPPLILAVNVSPHQFHYSNIAEVVTNILIDTQFPASYLELELTESGLMDEQDETIMLLNNLRAQGIHLAIDDFGTGYSSLAYLKRFPVDLLKIDKGFIDGLPYDQSDAEIAATIISMGHNLNFKVLAEGVENHEQLAFLQEKGCDIYQGYLKSKPLTAEEFAQLLREQN